MMYTTTRLSAPSRISTRIAKAFSSSSSSYASRDLLAATTAVSATKQSVEGSTRSWPENSKEVDCDNGGASSPWDRYLAGGAGGISCTVVDKASQRVKLSWTDGHHSEFSFKWLRDHSTDAFNPHTRQRELDTFRVSNDVLVKEASVTANFHENDDDPKPADARQYQVLTLCWSVDPIQPGQESTIPVNWLRQRCTSSVARDLRRRYGAASEGVACQSSRLLWGADVFTAGNNPPCLEYDQIMKMDQSQPQVLPGVVRLIGLLRSHGIALVRGVPTDMAGTEALARKIGHPRSTLYGSDMWATSAEADSEEEAFKDSAYSKGSLRSHTDCTYLVDPPGLQVFNCVYAAAKGGASTYVDGFAVAERLRVENPEAFEFFSSTPLSYHCFDEGCHYAAKGPIFRLGTLGEMIEVRHNDYDRAPLDYLSNNDIDRFYKYHQHLSETIRDPAMVARIELQPGDTVILDNHRTMHGRESFEGRRRLIGCYIGMDELMSSARVYGL